jgi:hypothetical protein
MLVKQLILLATMMAVAVAGEAGAQAQTRPVGQTSASAAAPRVTTEEDIKLLRADIREKRKSITAANMSLTADEATRFWPLYDEYIAETMKINDKRWQMMKDYAASYTGMTDAQAEDHMQRSAAVDQEFLALRVKYVGLMEKVIPARKAVQFYQIDRRLDHMINMQLASLIPIIDPKE